MSDTAEEAEDRLYGLMEIAERQQGAVQAALDGLAAERGELRREREVLAEQVQDLQRALQTTVRATVTDSLAGAATEGVAAVQVATRPLLDRVAGVTERVEQADAALRRVTEWASWRLLGWMAGALAVLLILSWAGSSAVLWWDASAIGAARAEKAQLEADVAELRANYDGWVKAGMLSKIERCGPRNRPCIRVDQSAGSFGEQADYRVIRGY